MPDFDSQLAERAVRILKDARRIEAEIHAMRQHIAHFCRYTSDSSKKQFDAKALSEIGDKVLEDLVKLDKRLDKAVAEAEDIASNAAKAHARGITTSGLNLNKLRATLNHSLSGFQKAVVEMEGMRSSAKTLMNDPLRTSGGKLRMSAQSPAS